MPARTELADDLFSRALLRGTFTLRSGAVSDRYFDKYRVTTHPRLLDQVAGALHTLLGEHDPTAQLIVAPALGAVPLAAALSLRADLPFVIVRTERKQYGTAAAIEGVHEQGVRGVLVEDVVTSGGAALDAVALARTAGIELDVALCVLDRGEGGAAALSQQGVHLHAVLGADDLREAYERGLGVEVAGTAG